MRIQVVQSGGFAGLRVERAVETERLDAGEREHYEHLLAEACFFDLPARCVCGLPDVIQCRVHIHAHGREHEVTTDQPSASRALWALVERVLAIEA